MYSVIVVVLFGACIFGFFAFLCFVFFCVFFCVFVLLSFVQHTSCVFLCFDGLFSIDVIVKAGAVKTVELHTEQTKKCG